MVSASNFIAEDLVDSLLEANKYVKQAAGVPAKKPPVIVLNKVAKRNRTFDKMFSALPNSVKEQVRDTYAQWVQNPAGGGLNFERLQRGGGRFWSVRIGGRYRAMCRAYDDAWLWFWVGTHEEYNKLLNGLDRQADPLFT